MLRKETTLEECRSSEEVRRTWSTAVVKLSEPFEHQLHGFSRTARTPRRVSYENPSTFSPASSSSYNLFFCNDAQPI